MAFVSHTLPTQPRRSTATRQTIHASLPPGRISVSRRRRMWDFQQQAQPESPASLTPARSTSKRAVAPSTSSPLPAPALSPSTATPGSTSTSGKERTTIVADIIKRTAEREAAIAADSNAKRKKWEAELAALRDPTSASSRSASGSGSASTSVKSSVSASVGPSASTFTEEKPAGSAARLDAVSSPPAVTKIEETDSGTKVSEVDTVEPVVDGGDAEGSAGEVDTPEEASSPSPKIEETPIGVPGVESVISGATSVADLYGPPSSGSREENSSSAEQKKEGNRNVWETWADAASAAVKSVTNSFDNMSENAEDFSEGVGEFVGDIAGDAEDLVGDAGENVQEVFSEFVSDTKKMFTDGLPIDGISEAAADALLGNSESAATRTDTTIGENDLKSKDKKSGTDGSGPEDVAQARSAASPAASGEKKTLGEKLLDAIVEGVPNGGVDEVETPAESMAMSELAELVENGKLQNLTVTKLRRILSSNGLKTSGRKAELIARLTSYVKK